MIANAQRWNRLRGIVPYLGPAASLILSAGLVATIYRTTVELQWLAFLAGALFAASIALASRSFRNPGTIAPNSSQLAAALARLTTESVLRKRAELALADVNRLSAYADELPAMVAYVDVERRLQYHNPAYAQWLGKGNSRLEGRPVAELLGAETWREVGARLDEAFAGSVVRYERLQTMFDAQRCRLAVLYLPHFGEQGTVIGVFCVLADVTRPEDSRGSEAVARAIAPGAEHALYSSTLAGELTAWDDVPRRLKDALEANEFSLHAQRIEPAAADASAAPFLEILLRLQEEEDNMVPPGAFLPLAEEHGLLPDIDRWVVRQLLRWAPTAPGGAQALFSLNVSAASMAEPGFIDFVRDCLRPLGGRGPGICFEFNEAEAMANVERTAEFVRELANDGCRFALSGFGRDPVSFTLQRRIAFDYIKIDAGIIVAVTRGPVELAKVKAINRVAHSLGAKTIALCVESDAARSVLADAGVDFVQGFAVCRPAPLASFFDTPARAAA